MMVQVAWMMAQKKKTRVEIGIRNIPVLLRNKSFVVESTQFVGCAWASLTVRDGYIGRKPTEK